MSEIWTAKEKYEASGKTFIVFDVLDEKTGEMRETRRYQEAIPMMLMLGGYDPFMASLMADHELPWKFRKVGDNIYLDGRSIGVEGYHEIE